MKIIIKDLKKSRLYHELINEVHKKESLNIGKYKDVEHSCSLHVSDKIKKIGLY